jgi:DNA helicase-2/ATP-dependent DNA helicase PcrA
VLAFVKDSIGLGGAMSLLDNSRGGEGSSHLDDLDALEQVAGLHPDLGTFDAWIRSRLASDGWTDDPNGVTLSTVHRVKGMEWRRVAVFGVNAGILPHRLAEDVEEERRVLHVALTRCQDQVVLLADQSRPSPMLAELDHPAAPRSAPSAGGSRGVAGAGVGGAGASGIAGRAGAAAAGARSRPARAASARSDLPAVDPVVEQALRAWRTERSRHDGVSAYIVMHDTTLLAIAATRPSSLVALRRVDGIGPAKLELYGDEILAVLAALDDQIGAGAGSP